MYLNEVEQRCIKVLAECFSQQPDHGHWSREKIIELVGIDDDQYIPLMKTMESAGVISPHSASGAYALKVSVKADAVQMHREIEANHAKERTQDVVKSVQDAIRQNPWTAWPILGFLALTTVVTFVSQLLTVLEKTGFIGK